jgi:hypothetical protein
MGLAHGDRLSSSESNNVDLKMGFLKGLLMVQVHPKDPAALVSH